MKKSREKKSVHLAERRLLFLVLGTFYQINMAVFKLLIVSTLLVKVSILASSIEVRVISKS